MKLSFSLPPRSRSSSKRSQVFDQDEAVTGADGGVAAVEFVTEFDPSKTPPKPAVNMPVQVNTWRPMKKTRNIESIAERGEHANLQFELENPTASAGSKSDVSYGLNVRPAEIGEEKSWNQMSKDVNTAEDSAVDRFRQNVKSLPEGPGIDEFNAMPVEEFAPIFFSAHGWSEGKGIGRNAKEDVKVKEYTRRPERTGLGFTPEEHDKWTAVRFAGSRAPVSGAPKGQDGPTGRKVASEDSVLSELRKMPAVNDVRIVDGRYAGLKGKIVKKLIDNGDHSVILNLAKSSEEVTVSLNQVVELGSIEEEKFLHGLQELHIREQDSANRTHKINGDEMKPESIKDKRSRDYRRMEELQDGGRRKEKKAHSRSKKEEMRGKSEHADDAPPPWLHRHIKVRIISKYFNGGKLYLKKGEVVDVVGPRTCNISMDESRDFIEGVDQEILETALPKRGGPVLVLFGKHRGLHGILVERDLDKEIGVVRDADSHTLVRLRLEQIAEYTGHPSFLGY